MENENVIVPGRQVMVPIVQPVVPTPDVFDFTKPELWPMWKKRFVRYLNVSGNSIKPEEEKVDLLIYLMGEKAEEILKTIPEPAVTLNELLTQLDAHFRPAKNVIFERFKFNTRKQQEDESVENFIRALHVQADLCDFNAMKDELIRDQIVVGMKDIKTSEKLQMKTNLTLALAIQMARQAEMQRTQTTEIRRDEEEVSASIQAIKKKSADKTKSERPRGSGSKGGKCLRCGATERHTAARPCPATKDICRKCDKVGHWQKVCLSKQNSSSTPSPSNNTIANDESFVGKVFESGKQRPHRHKLIEISEGIGKKIFLLDSGADEVCLPLKCLPRQALQCIVPYKPVLRGPDSNPIAGVAGQLPVTLYYAEKVYQCNAVVIETLPTPLLSFDAMIALGFWKNGSGSVNVVQGQHTDVEVEKCYPSLFHPIGAFKDTVTLKLKPGAKPYAQNVPRPVPLPLLPKVKDELDNLERQGIIERVEEATPWVAPIVVVNQGKKIRLCGDYTHLNEFIERPYFPLQSTEYTLAKLKGAKIFSKIDANKSFYQVKLDGPSSLLTCFITPFGRFKFNGLPFGICSSSEHFMIKYGKIFEGLENVITHVDDVLVYADTKVEHDRILRCVLDRMRDAGVTINPEKSSFGVAQVHYLGHVLSSAGIQIDQERVLAIAEFATPTDKTELQRFLGIVNFAERYIPNKATLLSPLHQLLIHDAPFVWGMPQQQTFNEVKRILQQAPILGFYDPNKKQIVQADSSSYGIGCAHFQVGVDGKREFIGFHSKTLTDSQKRYSQIEKEALALTWAADRLSIFLEGIQFVFETDHKPLLQILQSKQLDELTPRLQRFRMRLLRFSYSVVYVPGKELIIADALSRSPRKTGSSADNDLESMADSYIRFVVNSLPVKDYYLEKIRIEQQNDPICQQIIYYSRQGWPNREVVLSNVKPYYQYRNEFHVSEDLLMKNSRIVIPNKLHKEVIDFIHTGHQGITKCRRRAQQCVWWLGISQQLADVVTKCPNCIEERLNPSEPFLKADLPTHPWQKLGIDLFKHKQWFLIVTDYYSKYFEIFPLVSMTEEAIINKLKGLFGRLGIPQVVQSDGGPQFKTAFKKFAEQMNFTHVTSSPYHSQSCGQVESTVKIAKQMLKKNVHSEIYLALMAYRSTPLANGYSPAELLYNRKLRTNVPMAPSALTPKVPSNVLEKNDELKDKQAQQYNRRHNARPLPPLNVNDRVWVTDIRKYGLISKVLPFRSYLIVVNGTTYRRNRRFLLPTHDQQPRADEPTPSISNEGETDEVNDAADNDGSYESHDESEDTPHTPQTSQQSPDSPDISPPQVAPREQRTRRPPAWFTDYVLS